MGCCGSKAKSDVQAAFKTEIKNPLLDEHSAEVPQVLFVHSINSITCKAYGYIIGCKIYYRQTIADGGKVIHLPYLLYIVRIVSYPELTIGKFNFCSESIC